MFVKGNGYLRSDKYKVYVSCFLDPTDFIWLSNNLTLRVPCDGYSRNASCALKIYIYVCVKQKYEMLDMLISCL